MHRKYNDLVMIRVVNDTTLTTVKISADIPNYANRYYRLGCAYRAILVGSKGIISQKKKLKVSRTSGNVVLYID